MQVCAQFFDECMAFLQSSEEVPPKCAPIFLGPDIGLANVFKFNDETGDCDLSITELGNVCRDFFEECMSFLESSEEVPPRCEPVFLGPDVGLVNVFTFNDATQDCQVRKAPSWPRSWANCSLLPLQFPQEPMGQPASSGST
jgi:hypothetical protein